MRKFLAFIINAPGANLMIFRNPPVSQLWLWTNWKLFQFLPIMNMYSCPVALCLLKAKRQNTLHVLLTEQKNALITYQFVDATNSGIFPNSGTLPHFRKFSGIWMKNESTNCDYFCLKCLEKIVVLKILKIVEKFWIFKLFSNSPKMDHFWSLFLRK